MSLSLDVSLEPVAEFCEVPGADKKQNRHQNVKEIEHVGSPHVYNQQIVLAGSYKPRQTILAERPPAWFPAHQDQRFRPEGLANARLQIAAVADMDVGVQIQLLYQGGAMDPRERRRNAGLCQVERIRHDDE